MLDVLQVQQGEKSYLLSMPDLRVGCNGVLFRGRGAWEGNRHTEGCLFAIPILQNKRRAHHSIAVSPTLILFAEMGFEGAPAHRQPQGMTRSVYTMRMLAFGNWGWLQRSIRYALMRRRPLPIFLTGSLVQHYSVNQ